MNEQKKMIEMYRQLTGEEKSHVTPGELCAAMAASAGRVAALVAAANELSPNRQSGMQAH